MADSTHRTLRRGLAATIAGLAIAVTAGVVVGGEHASASGVLSKDCIGGTGTAQQAQPGDTITCTITALGPFTDGSTVTIKPATPADATIPAGGCVKATPPSTTSPSYTTEVTSNGGTSHVCTFVVHVGPAVLPVGSVLRSSTFGTLLLGTEQLLIATGTPAGTPVTQNAVQCDMPPLIASTTPTCLPSHPVFVTGAASCVGGTVPVVCATLPATTSAPATASATPSDSGNGGNTNTGGNTDTPTPGAVKAAATSTPFTGGPDHPLPVAAALVAAGGALVAFLAAAGPSIVRRRHLP